MSETAGSGSLPALGFDAPIVWSGKTTYSININLTILCRFYSYDNLQWRSFLLGYPHWAHLDFWMWYDDRPQRRHKVCVLLWRLPKLDVPFVCKQRYINRKNQTAAGRDFRVSLKTIGNNVPTVRRRDEPEDRSNKSGWKTQTYHFSEDETQKWQQPASTWRSDEVKTEINLKCWVCGGRARSAQNADTRAQCDRISWAESTHAALTISLELVPNYSVLEPGTTAVTTLIQWLFEFWNLDNLYPLKM